MSSVLLSIIVSHPLVLTYQVQLPRNKRTILRVFCFCVVVGSNEVSCKPVINFAPHSVRSAPLIMVTERDKEVVGARDHGYMARPASRPCVTFLCAFNQPYIITLLTYPSRCYSLDGDIALDLGVRLGQVQLALQEPIRRAQPLAILPANDRMRYSQNL